MLGLHSLIYAFVASFMKGPPLFLLLEPLRSIHSSRLSMDRRIHKKLQFRHFY